MSRDYSKTGQQFKTKLTCIHCKLELPKTKEFFQVRHSSPLVNGGERFITACKSCRLKYSKEKAYNSMDYYIARSLTDAKTRAKKKGIPFDLDRQFMLDLLDKQNGKCALTGITLTKVSSDKTRRLPTNLSIDQIKPNAGYTKDNVQWVCNWANQYKTDLAKEKFIEFCNLVVEHNKNKVGWRNVDATVG